MEDDDFALLAWHRFLKPGGVLAVSELTWLTPERPEELSRHWMREYPEVDTASAKIAILERHGYVPLGYFPLPKHCWLDNYYRPMQARFAAFLARHGHSQSSTAPRIFRCMWAYRAGASPASKRCSASVA